MLLHILTLVHQGIWKKFFKLLNLCKRFLSDVMSDWNRILKGHFTVQENATKWAVEFSWIILCWSDHFNFCITSHHVCRYILHDSIFAVCILLKERVSLWNMIFVSKYRILKENKKTTINKISTTIIFIFYTNIKVPVMPSSFIVSSCRVSSSIWLLVDFVARGQ